jgi:WD40 repeat protein
MKLFEDVLIVTLVVVGLVLGGLWCANELCLQDWPLPAFSAGTVSRLRPPEPSVNRVDWSADGEELLSLSRGEPDNLGSLALHTPAVETTSRILMDIREPIGAVAFARDGRHVLLGTNTGELQWIELESLAKTTLVDVHRAQKLNAFTAVSVAADGSLIAGGTSLGVIYLCDPATRRYSVVNGDQDDSVVASAATTEGPAAPGPTNQKSLLSDLRFSTDRRWLASAQNDGCVCLWEVSTGKLLQKFTGHRGPATAVAFLPGNRILSAGLDDTVRIWDIASGHEQWHGEFGLGGVKSAAVSADGRTAAWGGYAHKIITWDIARGEKKFEFNTPAGTILDLEFSPDGRLLAAAGTDGAIRRYDLQTARELKEIKAVASKHR